MGCVVRGIILAAGASRRMGLAKAALPLAHRADTFLARIIRTLFAAGLPEIVVVSGASPELVRRAAGPVDQRVTFIANPRWQDGQLSSLLAGLGDAPVEAAMVTLVDVPFVTPATVGCLLREWRQSGAPVVRPASGDRHGHPVIFDRVVFPLLRRADPAAGARTVVRALADRVRNVPIDDPGAFLDVDTPDEYRAALGSGC